MLFARKGKSAFGLASLGLGKQGVTAFGSAALPALLPLSPCKLAAASGRLKQCRAFGYAGRAAAVVGSSTFFQSGGLGAALQLTI